MQDVTDLKHINSSNEVLWPSWNGKWNEMPSTRSRGHVRAGFPLVLCFLVDIRSGGRQCRVGVKIDVRDLAHAQLLIPTTSGAY